MSAAHQLFRPATETPNLWRPITDFLDEFRLKVEADGYSKANFENHRLSLTRFAMAWAVRMPSGRMILIPSPDKRPRSLKWLAASPEEAISQAEKLAKQISSPGLAVVEGQPTVCRNGERPLSDLSNDDLRLWLIANPQWKSDWCKENNIRSIEQCFNNFADENNLPAIFKKKKMPKFRNKKQRREATDTEYIALMRPWSSLVQREGGTIRVTGSPKELRRALWCIYNVGVRTCELREMVWPDVKWENGTVELFQHKTARATGRSRVIVLTPRQYRMFKLLHRQRRPWPENVFVNTRGKPWTRTSFAKLLRETALRIGLDQGVAERVTGYCFRHTWATQADEAGVPDEDAAKLLGHSTEVFRNNYSKAGKKMKHLRGIANTVEQGRRDMRRAPDQGDLCE